jgi:predicted helicase
MYIKCIHLKNVKTPHHPKLQMSTFQSILKKFRQISFNERDKGNRFERLMQAYLLTDPFYASRFKKVWLWDEFPGKEDLGTFDTGIDLVAVTNDGEYWAIQCKCYAEDATIDKPAVDSFLSTSSRRFNNDKGLKVGFSRRLWIETTGKRWGSNAEEAINNQNPPVTRLNLFNLIDAPVDWNKLEQGTTGELSRTPKKKLFPHQQLALDKAHDHFKREDRGKLIMACGTGKTFTALRIAENETRGKGLVLFLVPSIALLSQSLREWSSDSIDPINAICICSDPEVSRKKSKNDDTDSFSIIDLALPASTNVKDILNQFTRIDKKTKPGLTVVFSTYQSIDVIAKAQKEIAKENSRYSQFDMIICDEAHRTTGVTLSGEDESSFTKVHNENFLRAKKRLYMTATPRLYNDDTKSKAAQADAALCSMDEPKFYGEEIYRIGFGEAVERDLLTDYKVLILTLNQNDIPPAVQAMISNREKEINTDDISKLIGCINALSKQILGDSGIIKDSDPEPMRRAVAFCQNIQTSKRITETFNTATSAYLNELPDEKKSQMVSIASKHIDGTFSAPSREELLSWLKDGGDANECRVLTNVRCLSEGVDVPSLDAVMFLSARNSQVDVVQSVGRVMRKSPGKKYGYIIIPVVVPADVEADKALDDNERYKVVWTVLNALRAHDDRFNALVNKIELNKARPSQILVGRPEYSWEDGLPIVADPEAKYNSEFGKQIAIQFEQLQGVVFARMVQKVGDRRYWEQWARNVAEIAERQVERIKRLIKEDEKHKKAFDKFLKGLKKNINPSISVEEAIDMLSQHIITKPVFEALFENYSFVKNNPISVSMQKILDILEDQSFHKDAETLNKFYDSVRMRAKGIDNAVGKQRIIIELYDKFFKTAFPLMVEKLGIVYTPIEVVDFIIHSVDDVLKKELGQSISDENIHILDPFTGTGTFITRLLESGLIDKKDLKRKYENEIHANEMVLLAYYIAAVNIENAYHDVMGQKHYSEFRGICLTDTFQLGETDDGEQLFSEMFPQNSKRVQKQQKAPLRIIIGNPPYSRGQDEANDNAQNQFYPKLEKDISDTYAKESNATLSRDLYNSFIKAFRWSTDKLDENGGIIGFITGSGWIDKGGYDGFRKCLEKDFSSIYVFNLRGDIRGRSKEAAKKEGQNVFDIMTGVAITLLVKKPDFKGKAAIFYHDIGDYLNRKEKIDFLQRNKSLVNLDYMNIFPNDSGDWINQRNTFFETLIQLEPKKNFNSKSHSVFLINGVGASSAREHWVYGFSQTDLEKKLKRMISFYNSQRLNFQNKKAVESPFDKISWSVNLKKDAEKNIKHEFKSSELIVGMQRPFTKSHLYYHKPFIERPGIGKEIFPDQKHFNLAITIPGLGNRKDFVALMTNHLPDYNNYDGGCKYFPLYFYEERQKLGDLFDDDDEGEYIRRDGISDFILSHTQKQFSTNNITKEDIFYYVYGFLHSVDYREIFANDLKKMLPRLLLVEDVKDFWTFSKAGRSLAELHTNYETVPPAPEVNVNMPEEKYQMDAYEFYAVEKMRFPKKDQKDTIIYNSRITITNIPTKAYEYVVNGKSAIEWILERYQITTHKESGITNNPNHWSQEVENPRYVLDLLLSIINVSVQTVNIVSNLPKVKFE